MCVGRGGVTTFCNLVRHLSVAHQPRCASEMNQICLSSIIEGGARQDSMAHPTPCATESWVSVAHPGWVRHRKLAFCGAWAKDAPQKVKNFCGAPYSMRH